MIKRFVIDLIQSTIKHNIGSLAATIAFFGFSSLLPVLALLIYITSFFVPEATVARSYREFCNLMFRLSLQEKPLLLLRFNT